MENQYFRHLEYRRRDIETLESLNTEVGVLLATGQVEKAAAARFLATAVSDGKAAKRRKIVDTALPDAEAERVRLIGMIRPMQGRGGKEAVKDFAITVKDLVSRFQCEMVTPSLLNRYKRPGVSLHGDTHIHLARVLRINELLNDFLVSDEGQWRVAASKVFHKNKEGPPSVAWILLAAAEEEERGAQGGA